MGFKVGWMIWMLALDGRRRRVDWKNNNRGKNAAGEESEWECLGPKTKSLEFAKTTF